MQTSTKAGDASSVLEALKAFTLHGSVYKPTLREKLNDERAGEEKAAVATTPEGIYAVLQCLKTVRANPPPPLLHPNLTQQQFFLCYFVR